MYKGDERQVTAEVRVDGVLVTTWTSSGTTVGAESIVFSDTTSGQVVEVTGVLGDSEWLSIIEVSLCPSRRIEATYGRNQTRSVVRPRAGCAGFFVGAVG